MILIRIDRRERIVIWMRIVRMMRVLGLMIK
jgi:hypothetical protein